MLLVRQYGTRQGITELCLLPFTMAIRGIELAISLPGCRRFAENYTGCRDNTTPEEESFQHMPRQHKISIATIDDDDAEILSPPTAGSTHAR